MEIPQRVKKLEKKPAPTLVPGFGPLKGVRVLQTASMIAAPHAGTMMADFGAEVIHVEAPGVGDKMRTVGPFISRNGKKVSTLWADNARNRLSMELDLHIDKKPLSKEVFLALIKSCDIWIEGLPMGEHEYGITDELVSTVNPKITITHESGFGNPEFGGTPAMRHKPSSDLIAQAYSGWSYLTGEPDGPPTRIAPNSADYITALTASVAALTGYIHSRSTGAGQASDVAQFEAVARTLGDTVPCYFNVNHHISKRVGNKARAFQPYDLFQTSDGRVAVGGVGPGVFGKFLNAMKEATGLNPDDYPWSEVANSPEQLDSPKGVKLDQILREWLVNHTKKEATALFEKYDVPVGPASTAQDACEDEHWIDRNNFVECTDQTLQEKIKIFGIVPKMQETPGKVWRGAPSLGQDTTDILTRILDYTTEEIKQLREEKII
ncbi:MAG: CoA transferase [Dehalococcoidia bacterium]|nr:CoA transferase [Dehalococcoidia bacterium]